MTIPSKPSDYLHELEQRVETLEREFAELQQQAEGSREKAAKKVRELKQSFDAKRDALQSKLSDARDASDNAWAELRSGLDTAWKDLKDAFNRARGELRPDSGTPRPVARKASRG